MKKETGIQKIYTAVIVILAVLFSGCFLSGTTGELVSPTIRAIGLPDASVVSSVTLTITGPGMDPVEVSYSQLPSVINIAIPEGEDRTFELSVGLSSTFTSNPAIPYTSFKGTATADVTSDSAVVTLNMGVGSTKIIVPDYFNYRVLQFDDINGSNEIKLSSVDNPLFGTWLTSNTISGFIPYDVDFDSQGRIYIANFDPSEGIIRVDNMEGLNPYAFGVGWSITALSVDRVNNLIYYTDGGSVYKNDLDGSNEVFLTNGESISGMAVSNGYLFMVDAGILVKYNTSNDTSITFNDAGGILNSPWDVMVKDNYVYVANSGGNDNQMIIQLHTDLTSPVGYGINYDGLNWDTAKGHFYGPARFVAIMNKKITIVDDAFYYDKLVSMDDITGAGWQTLPQSGDGQGLFKFYSAC